MSEPHGDNISDDSEMASLASAQAEAAAMRALLAWHRDSGVDETIGAQALDVLAPLSAINPAPAQSMAAGARKLRPAKPTAAKPVTAIAPSDTPPADEAIRLAEKLAREAETIDALAAAVAAFNGCALKRGARNTVFIDGAVDGDLLVIGEGPGRDEDRIGKPFVGRAGQLLDKMLAAIDRSRDRDTLISNVVFWRPPGNRTPTGEETAICRPFVQRLIALSAPKAVLLTGGAPMEALLGVSGIMRNRGVWRDLDIGAERPIPALPIFHPAFLLRQPAQKRLAWRDLQSLSARLRDG